MAAENTDCCENMFDGDLFADENKDENSMDNTAIDFNCAVEGVSPAQSIKKLLSVRQPLLKLYDRLKFQQDNNMNSICINVSFKPVMGTNNHQQLDGQFANVVNKHRTSLISDILEIIDVEAKAQTEIISSAYKAEISVLNHSKSTEGLKTFVDTIRKEKNALDLDRNEANAKLSTSAFESRPPHHSRQEVGHTQRQFRGTPRGGFRARPRPYNKFH